MRMLAPALGSLAASLVLSLPAHAQGTWATRAPMPTARSAPVVGAIGNIVHVVGGDAEGQGCVYVNKHEAYDAATNTWTTKPSLSWTPFLGGAAVLSGQLFVIGGFYTCGGANAEVASYHPSTNTWTPRALLPSPRGAMGTGVIDGILYVVGGSTGGGSPEAVVNTLYAYNGANNTWTARAPMPTKRMGLATAVVDGILYAIGGWNGTSGVATVEAYDPGTNTWTTRAPMPVARSFMSAAAVGGKIYVMGGGYSSADSNEVRVYDPATNSWGTAAPMPTARGYTGSTVANGVIHTVGGLAAAIPRNANEAFTPPGAPGALSVTPASIDFGAQSRNTTSGPRTLTLANTGPGPLTLSGVTAAGPFALSGNCITIQAGASCPLAVTFTPTADGAQAGSIAIASSGGSATVALSGVGERSLVVHYYRSILRRDPDAGGKGFWEAEAARLTAAGGNVNEAWYAMAMAFYFSPEYAAFNRDNAGFVTDLYNTFFNRAPDAGGLAYWTGQLAQGMPREVLLAAFMFSPEFTTFTQAIFGNTPVRREIDAVFDFYRGLLSRLPDSGGLTYWIGQFRSAQCAGSAGQIAAQAGSISSAFVNSGEYAARGRSNAQFVGDLYNAFLRRGGDLAGVQFWIAELASGRRTREQVRQAFLESPEFSARVSALAAEGCQPSITAVAPALVPFAPVAIGFVGLDATRPIDVEFRSPGFSATVQALLVEGSTLWTGAPSYADPATGLPGTATVSLVLRQGSVATAPVMVALQPLPRSADYGLVLGDVTRAFLRYQIVLIGRRLNQLQSARLLLGADTAAAEAALLERLKLTVKAKEDADKVSANNALVINGGTTAAGNTVRFDRDVLQAMDEALIPYVLQVTEGVAPSAAGERAKATLREAYELLTKGDDIAKVINKNQEASGSRNPVLYTRAYVETVKLFLEQAAGKVPSSQLFAKRLGHGMALFDAGYAAIDCMYDLGSLWIDTRYGGDPVAIEGHLANLNKHRMDLLNASLGLIPGVWIEVVPPGTPGALNVGSVALTSNLAQLMQKAADYVVSLDSANRIRNNPFPAREGVGVIRGSTTQMPPQGSLHLCCIAGNEIIGMPDAAGNYEMLVPLNVPGTNYGSLTLSVREIVSGSSRTSVPVNLGNLPALGEMLLSPITVPNNCYAQYEACAAACPVGGFAGIQCVNACLAAYFACLG